MPRQTHIPWACAGLRRSKQQLGKNDEENDWMRVDDDAAGGNSFLQGDQHSDSGVDDDEQRIARKFGYTKEQFLARFGASGRAVWRTRIFFDHYGVDVEVPAMRVRRNLAEIREFTKHEADILLEGTPFSVEVKGRPGLQFKEPEGFGHPDVSVDTVSGYLAKTRKPLAYVMVSNDFDGAIVLPTFTASTWRKGDLFDKERRMWDEYYFASKHHLVGRRRWLISLCTELQNSAAGKYHSILEGHGFRDDALRDLYPR